MYVSRAHHACSRCGLALLWLATALGLPAVVHAADGPWKIELQAGNVERSGLPIRVPVEVEGNLPDGSPAQVLLPDGTRVTGQFTAPTLLEAPAAKGPQAGTRRDVLFVLPTFPAGTTLQVVLEAGGPAEAKPPRLAWKEQAGGIDLEDGGKPLVRYEMPTYDPSSDAARERTYKPFHHVFDSSRGTLLTKGDGGQYTHHRGLFFGYNKIRHGADMQTASDCWHCKGQARQEHKKVLEQAAGEVEARQRVAIDWIGSDAALVASETRELEVIPAPGGTAIDFASRLTTLAPVRLEGDPQHSGVHFRAAQEVAAATKGQTYYLRPDRKAALGEFRNWPADPTYISAPWHAASFVVKGQRYTVLRVNRPANPGEARMSERDYARFGSYFEHDLRPDAPLEVAYRWWVQPGEMTLEQAARIAADYAEPVRATLR